MENLKEIIGYEGLYKISPSGKVYNKKMHELKQYKSSSGTSYYQVCLCKNGFTKNFLVHRLVAKNYIDNPLNKSQVNHKDGNIFNNHVSNLEWVTPSENMKHSIHKLGNPSPPSWKGKFGKDHNRSKKIYEFDLKGNLLNDYESGLDFQRKTGVSHTSASWSIKYKKPIFNKYYFRTPHFEL
jgi:hypothetical protein